MISQQVVLHQGPVYLGTYSHSAAANMAGRVQAKATGTTVLARVYDVDAQSGTKVLVKKYSIVPKLDGTVVFA